MLNEEELKHEMGGSTAVVTLIKDKKLYCANAGDSRAIACVNGQAIALSHDHKPVLPKEMERIHDSGGWVENCRVNGSLALSRALGDFKYKQNKKVKAERQIVTGLLKNLISQKFDSQLLNFHFHSFAAYPDVEIHDIDESWEFALIASDGIWDVLSNDDVVQMCLRKIAIGTLPEQICEELMTECLSPDLLMTGTDNMTVVLICFLHNKSYDELSARAAEYVKNFEDPDTKSTKTANVDETAMVNGQLATNENGANVIDEGIEQTADDNNAVASVSNNKNDSTAKTNSDSNIVASETTSNGQTNDDGNNDTYSTQCNNDDSYKILTEKIQESKKFKETESADDLK